MGHNKCPNLRSLQRQRNADVILSWMAIEFDAIISSSEKFQLGSSKRSLFPSLFTTILIKSVGLAFFFMRKSEFTLSTLLDLRNEIHTMVMVRIEQFSQ